MFHSVLFCSFFSPSSLWRESHNLSLWLLNIPLTCPISRFSKRYTLLFCFISFVNTQSRTETVGSPRPCHGRDDTEAFHPERISAVSTASRSSHLHDETETEGPRSWYSNEKSYSRWTLFLVAVILFVEAITIAGLYPSSGTVLAIVVACLYISHPLLFLSSRSLAIVLFISSSITPCLMYLAQVPAVESILSLSASVVAEPSLGSRIIAYYSVIYPSETIPQALLARMVSLFLICLISSGVVRLWTLSLPVCPFMRTKIPFRFFVCLPSFLVYFMLVESAFLFILSNW